MKRNMVCIIALSFAILALCTGCSDTSREKAKKVVVQEDVHADLAKEGQIKVSMEKVDLKLKEGEYFNPAFYLNGEVYGDIDSGIGIIGSTEPTEQFPVGGQLKQYLYKLQKDNAIKQTSKKVFTHIYGSEAIGYEAYKTDGRLYCIDYLTQDEPIEVKKLDEVLKSTGYHDNIYINKVVTDNGKDYFIIRGNVPYKGYASYFYDIGEDKLYKRKGDILNQDSFVYIKTLKSFVYIDNDLKCYKVKFNSNEFDLIEYMDLDQYIKLNPDKKSKGMTCFTNFNDEEILITKLKPFKEGGYFDFHPTFETEAIYIFNFKTNEFQTLLSAKEGQHTNVEYIGIEGVTGKKLFVFDEFQNHEGYISPKKRYFKTLNDGQLNTIFEEDISEEGKTLSTSIFTRISEDGKEVFLTKQITDMENDVETTKATLYKKYTFK